MKVILTMGNVDEMQKHQILIENVIQTNSNMVRCCVSKASYEEHVEAIMCVKKLYKHSTGRDLEIMLDVAIPKDKERIVIANDMELQRGDVVILQALNNDALFKHDKVIHTEANISIHEVGDEFILGDSIVRMILEEKIEHNCVKCRVTNQYGVIKNGIGIASKRGCIKVSNDNIYDKCMRLIDKIHPECIVLSYIETKDDVNKMKDKIITPQYRPSIMAKIETYESVINRRDIIECSDQIMIARGCLGVNVGLENLMAAQDIVIAECNNKEKEVCVASNILKSLGSQSVPCRTDVVDVAHMIQSRVDFFVITDSISRSTRCYELLRYIELIEEPDTFKTGNNL